MTKILHTFFNKINTNDYKNHYTVTDKLQMSVLIEIRNQKFVVKVLDKNHYLTTLKLRDIVHLNPYWEKLHQLLNQGNSPWFNTVHKKCQTYLKIAELQHLSNNKIKFSQGGKDE